MNQQEEIKCTVGFVLNGVILFKEVMARMSTVLRMGVGQFDNFRDASQHQSHVL